MWKGIKWHTSFMDDIGNNTEFVRRDEAKLIGLSTVIGIPLFHNEEVIGVMVIGVKK
jgi:hypothetical protein